MLKKLRKWREHRACKRCKLRAICLSQSAREMGRKINNNPSIATRRAMPCKVVRQYGEEYWLEMESHNSVHTYSTTSEL